MFCQGGVTGKQSWGRQQNGLHLEYNKNNQNKKGGSREHRDGDCKRLSRHLLCAYRIYSNKRRGAYVIFCATSAALIRGRRLFKGGLN